MKPTSILTAALTCAALLGLYPGSVIAQPTSEKPFPEELKITQYKHPKIDKNEWAEVIDFLCSMVISGSLEEIDSLFKEADFKGKELPMLTRTSCGKRSPIRTAFTSGNISRSATWEYIISIHGIVVLNVPDPADQLNVLDYLVLQKAFLESNDSLNSTQRSLLQAATAYIPALKKMGAVHSKYFLWKRGVRAGQ